MTDDETFHLLLKVRKIREEKAVRALAAAEAAIDLARKEEVQADALCQTTHEEVGAADRARFKTSGADGLVTGAALKHRSNASSRAKVRLNKNISAHDHAVMKRQSAQYHAEQCANELFQRRKTVEKTCATIELLQEETFS